MTPAERDGIVGPIVGKAVDGMEGVLGVVFILLVPCLVWAAVIAGLVSIVRDKVREHDMPQQAMDPPASCILTQHKGVGAELAIGPAATEKELNQ
jgi:hypothetical protein